MKEIENTPKRFVFEFHFLPFMKEWIVDISDDEGNLLHTTETHQSRKDAFIAAANWHRAFLRRADRGR